MRVTRTAVLAASCLLSLTAYAQIKITFGSDKIKDGPPYPTECIEAGNVLITELRLFPHPSRWTYIILCDDSAWTEAMRRTDHTDSLYIFGATDQESNMTMLRGTTLRGEDPRITAEHLVAHELAHIYLHTHSDKKADTLAMAWIQTRERPVQAASIR